MSTPGGGHDRDELDRLLRDLGADALLHELDAMGLARVGRRVRCPFQGCADQGPKRPGGPPVRVPAWHPSSVPLGRPVPEDVIVACMLRRARLRPELIAERELALTSAMRLWGPLYDWRLTVSGHWQLEDLTTGAASFERTGWLMDPGVLRIFSGEVSGRAEIWLAEDVMDWLVLATHWGEADELEHGVLGLAAAPWSPALARHIPDGSTVVVTRERTGAQVLGTLSRRPVAVQLWRRRT